MKAAILYQAGTTPVYEEFPDPIAKDREEILTVKATSIKNIDRMRAGGTHYDPYTKFPMVVGHDGVGLLSNGSRVYAGSFNGMMADKAAVPAAWVVPVPIELDDATAAALPNPAVSGWLSLTSGKTLNAHDTVVILGATGTTGQLAVQLARELGVGRIIAIGRNKTILNTLEGLGAHKVISLQDSPSQIIMSLQEEMHQQPVSRVLDYLWGGPAEIVLEALSGHSLHAKAHPIKYIQIGEMAGGQIHLSAATLRSSAIEICGQGGGSISADLMKRIPQEIIPALFDLAVQRKLVIATVVVPLPEIATVWNKEIPGKRIVLVP